MTCEAPDQPLGWSRTTVARMLDCSTRQLDRIRESDPNFPPPFRCGSSNRWDPERITEWRAGQYPAKTRARMARLVNVRGGAV